MRRLVQLVLHGEGHAEAVVNVRVIRMRRQKSLEMFGRLTRLLLLQQARSQVAVGFGELRIEAQRLPVLGDGIFHPAALRQRDPQLVVRGRIVWTQPQVVLVVADRFVELAVPFEVEGKVV